MQLEIWTFSLNYKDYDLYWVTNFKHFKLQSFVLSQKMPSTIFIAFILAHDLKHFHSDLHSRTAFIAKDYRVSAWKRNLMNDLRFTSATDGMKRCVLSTLDTIMWKRKRKKVVFLHSFITVDSETKQRLFYRITIICFIWDFQWTEVRLRARSCRQRRKDCHWKRRMCFVDRRIIRWDSNLGREGLKLGWACDGISGKKWNFKGVNKLFITDCL